jgi:DNA polymerase
LWRIAFENHHLLKVETDDEVIHLLRMEDAVSRDVHHVHAFVRFKKVTDAEGERYVAWYKPDHKSIRLAAPFFAKRFASMRWSILTPDGSAHWDGKSLRFTEGVDAPPANEDALEELWSRYYATTYNPARTNLRTMRSEMPQRFWNNMPELANLGQVLATAPARVDEMIAVQKRMPGAGAFVPPGADLRQLRDAVSGCEGCELYKHATQPVFGEGPADARVVLIGEQPGDSEDRAGRPFVGPAGEVLNRALAEAGMDRSDLYLTNAVKHFAFEERGKRRIHRTPRLSEVTACKPWMEAELERVSPEFVVCLGATAAKAVFGAQFRLTEQRGKFLESRFGDKTLATYHPSAVLRADSQAAQDELYRFLVEDLKRVAAATANSARGAARVANAGLPNRKSLFT